MQALVPLCLDGPVANWGPVAGLTASSDLPGKRTQKPLVAPAREGWPRFRRNTQHVLRLCPPLVLLR